MGGGGWSELPWVTLLYLLAAVTALAHLWAWPIGVLHRARVNRLAWTVGLVLLPFIAPVAYWLLIPRRIRRVVKTGWP